MPQWNGSPAVWHTASFTRNGTPRNGRPGASVGRRGARFGARPFEALVDDRVERRVQRLDARDRGVDELGRRHVAARDELGLRGRVEPGVGVGHRAQRLSQRAGACAAAAGAPDRLRPWTTPTSAGAASLAAALEPVIGQVFFSPECHAAYAQLGFAPSPGRARARRAARRSGVLHEPGLAARPGAPGVVAAAFGVFKPEVVVGRRAARLVAHRRARRSSPRAARGAVAQLERVLGAGRRQCRPRVGAARARGRAARRRGPPAVRRAALVVGRSDRPVDAPVPPRRHAPRVPRRRAHLRRGRAPRSTRSRSVCSTTSTWACRCAATCARAGWNDDELEAGEERLRAPRLARRRRAHRRRPRRARRRSSARPTGR